jgi:hypothetical protein
MSGCRKQAALGEFEDQLAINRLFTATTMEFPRQEEE